MTEGEKYDSAGVVGIILAGAPASGKGTQCEKIRERFGVIHLSTGDMLRSAVSEKSDVGIIAKEYMDKGHLVPDDVIISVVKERLQQKDCQKSGWLLDGFPRTSAQAKALLELESVEVDCFILLDVSDNLLVERVVGRRSDPVTGKIYHMKFSPPPEDIIPRLQVRSDDTEAKVKVRLKQYHKNIVQVTKIFRSSPEDPVVIIDGGRDPKLVAQSVFEALEEKCGKKLKQAPVSFFDKILHCFDFRIF